MVAPWSSCRELAARVFQEARRVKADKAARWIGLDLGSQSIKIVELALAAGTFRIVKSLIQDLPAAPSGVERGLPAGRQAQAGLPAAEEGRAVDRLGWLQSALKEFAASEVHISAGGPDVAMRRVTIPLMSRQELPEAVKWQVKEQIPFSVQDALFDFRVTGEVWEKDIKKQDVLVAAAARPFIQHLIETVERAGARVASISPTHAALWACAAALLPDLGRGSVALVEIGADETEVTIVKDGQIRLVHNLAVGSDSLTGSLMGIVVSEQGQMTIDRSRAEALKRRYGVLTDAMEGATEDGVPLFHLSSLMRPVLEHLLTELSRVFSYYRVQMDEAGVSRLLLCGGGATLKQLQPYLTDSLGVTVEVFNPLVRITERSQPLEPEQVAEGGPRLGVAIGLALEHGQRLNLMPVEVQRSRDTVVSRAAWARTAAQVGVAAVAVYLGLQLFSALLGGRIARQRNAWNSLAPPYEQSLRIATSAKRFDATVEQVNRLIERQPVWDGLLKELGTLVPATIELSELTVSVDGPPGHESLTFRLKGTGSAAAMAGEGSVAQLMETLEQSAFFSDVELVSSMVDQSDRSRVSIEIRGKLE